MGRTRILVMDDEEIVRKVARKMLVKMGYEFEEARDGEEAIALYRESLDAGCPFDVILIDLNIDYGMGGQEAFAELRKIDPDVRAIISSGFANDPIVSDYAAHGYTAAVRKPFLYDQLQGAIEACLAGAT